MNRVSRARLPQSDFLRDGTEAFIAGRFNLAASCFEKAHRAEPRDPVPLFNLATAKERLGEIDDAAVHLTRALRLRPSWTDPARRFSSLAARYIISSPAELDPHGLLAAFALPDVDHDPLAAAALSYLRATTMLGGAAHQAAIGNALPAARAMLIKRTDKTLAHPLLQAALTMAVNHDPNIEKLLTAMRRVILMELPAARYEDKALLAFACVLLQQCFNNEHVFSVSEEEAAKLKSVPVDWNELASGNVTASRHLLWQLLYNSPEAVIAGRLSSRDCRKLRPRGLAEVIAARLKEDEELTVRAAELVAIGEITDATSIRVGRQYHDYPYPRWNSLSVPAKGSARRRLERFFHPDRLTFFDGPFKVLIAGAGTGRQAIDTAFRYGENADLLAIDLSRRSLAYGARMASRFEVPNLRFAQADILSMGQGAGLFDIVEVVGVLHHLAEPFAGLRALSDTLRSGGLMLVGLYSSIARQNIARLHADPNYPGPSCDDEAARRYRARLIAGAGNDLLLRSHDFYSLSEFRDLVLHEQETALTLLEVEKQLSEAGLVFRGFNLPPPAEAQFAEMFPDDPWPGTLANWHAFEEHNPRTFDAMYRFWADKA
jgi:SAM-dependent methyltransferase